MAGLSPTQRTLRYLRSQGRIAAITEKWVTIPNHPGGGVRRDLFNFIDIICLDPQKGIVAIQSCGQSFKAHLDKIRDSECTENVIEWLNCGGKVELIGWRKLLRERGGKAKIWVPRIEEITFDMILEK